ncbi:MAG: EAL domain-containing protein [Gorillibacterium sp.]|nr:EAL domain-containing protein [Gorillibacterium sp.]
MMKRVMSALLLLIVLFLISPWSCYAEKEQVLYESEEGYPPYKFTQNGLLTGFDIELTNMIFDKREYTIQFTKSNWAEVYDDLIHGQIDTSGMMVISEERRKDILFSKPIFQTFTGLYSKKQFAGKVKLDNIGNYIVGVGKGQYSEDILKSQLKHNNYKTYNTVEDALNALDRGDIDLLFENQEVVNYLIIDKGMTGEIVRQINNLYPLDVGYGISKSAPQLVDYINKRIDYLKSTGIYEELHEKYFYTHSEMYKSSLRKKQAIIAISAIVLVILSYLMLKLYISFLKRVIRGEKEFSGSILYHSKIFIWAVKTDKTTIRFNSVAEQVTGLREDEIIGVKYDEVEQVNKNFPFMVELLNDGRVKNLHDNIEKNLIEKLGEQFFLFRTSIVHGLDGNPEIVVLIGFDITDRKNDENKLTESYRDLEAAYEELTSTEEELKDQYDELLFHQKELARSEERFRLALEGSDAVVWDYDVTNNLYFFSDRFYELTGYEKNELNESTGAWKSVIHPDDATMAEQARQAHMSGEIPFYYSEYRLRTKNGNYLWFQARGKAALSRSGKTVHFAGSMINITDKKQYEIDLESSYRAIAATQEELVKQYDQLSEKESNLRKSRQRYRLITEASHDGIWETDYINGTKYYSSRWYEQLGYEATSLLTFFDILHPDDHDRVHTAIDLHKSGQTEHYQCEYRLLMGSGVYHWFLGRGKALYNDSGDIIQFAGTNTNINDSKEYQEKLRHLAYYDSLSKLPNRLSLLETMEARFNQSEDLAALIFADLDNFKYINDTLGHKFGDSLIYEASKRLVSIVGSRGVVYRLGGDEFVIFLPDIKGKKNAVELAQVLLDQFKEPFHVNESHLHVTTSVGIAYYPEDGTNAEELLKTADVAMYKSKESGKANYTVYTKSMQNAFNNRMNIEKLLRNALKNQEFLLHYQPQLDLKTGQIAGFEALLRWESPELGMMSPYSFIKIAEDCRMIIPIGEWVLQTACTFVGKLHRSGHSNCRIAVNISVVQLVQDDFVPMIMRTLDRERLSPEFLELEITESIFMESFESIVAKLEILRYRGVRIALDDFGTGYSSLSYLKLLPITVLKIDKVFIDSIPDISQNRSLTDTIIALGHQLNLEVVAEGIETVEQLDYLREAGCDKVQGFFFSRPVPDGEALRLLEIEETPTEE